MSNRGAPVAVYQPAIVRSSIDEAQPSEPRLPKARGRPLRNALLRRNLLSERRSARRCRMSANSGVEEIDG
jgi:hypothetical protein